MAQADWIELADALSVASLRRGVTAEVTPPPPGTGFVFAYNSIDAQARGAHGWAVALPDFDPMAAGGSIRGCVKRVGSPGNVGMTPLLYISAEDSPPSVNSRAYILGLGDSDPYEVVLAKGVIASGLPGAAATDVTVLRRSSAQYSMGDDRWHNMRLDAIVEPCGDVLLKVFANDLVAHPLGTTPDWQPIVGMADFVDGITGIASGSAPLILGGWCGFAFAVAAAVNRRGAFRALQADRSA